VSNLSIVAAPDCCKQPVLGIFELRGKRIESWKFWLIIDGHGHSLLSCDEAFPRLSGLLAFSACRYAV
jgi:hypothetical protein